MLKEIRRLRKKLQAQSQALSKKATSTKPTQLLGWSQRFLSHRLTTKSSIFHIELCRDLDAIKNNRGAKECRIAPRGSAKSTISTLADPLRDALEGKEPYQVIIGDIQPNANKFLKDIKDEIETNEKLKEAYPDACGVGPVWQQEAIELPNGSRIESLGKGGKIRGRRHRQHRPTKFIIDDPQSLEDSYSETQMEKDFHWLMSDVMKAGAPDSNFVVLGTALAKSCIVCRLSQTAGWKFKRYKGLIKEPKNMDAWLKWRPLLWQHDDPDRDKKVQQYYLDHKEEMDEGAEVLWPERFPLVQLMHQRYSEGERSFMTEVQGEPMPPGGAEWAPELFENIWVDDFPHPKDCIVKVLALDPSKGSKDKIGDYSAYVLLCVDRQGIIYLGADMDRTRDSLGIVRDGLQLIQKYKPDAFAVETNASQELFGIIFRSEAKEQSIYVRFDPSETCDGPIYVPIEHYQSKVGRIREWSKPLGYRKVRIVRSMPQSQLLLDQFLLFPRGGNDPGVDDGPDAAQMALHVAQSTLKHGTKLIRSR